jgi:hypothetical protein
VENIYDGNGKQMLLFVTWHSLYAHCVLMLQFYRNPLPPVYYGKRFKEYVCSMKEFTEEIKSNKGEQWSKI